MPKNLTPVAEYTGNVTVPTGGDARTALSVETPMQTVTNRAAYAKEQLDLLKTYCEYQLSGTNEAHDVDKWTLTEVRNVGGFSLSSNEIVFPAVGKYLVLVKLVVQDDDTTNPLLAGATLQVAGVTIDECVGQRFSATAALSIRASTSYVLNVTDIVAQKLCFRVYGGASDISLSASASRVIIRRLA